MIKYSLNIQQSKDIYELYKHCIKIKDCYRNVFYVVTEDAKNLQHKKWSVAYGYMTVAVNVLCRHCFIINDNNEVIDPTIFSNTFVDIDREYYVMKTFDSMQEYLDAIEEEECFPSLNYYLLNYEKAASEWAMKNGFILLG